MKKLTAEECLILIDALSGNRSIREDKYLAALEIALQVLEQQEKACQKCDGSGAMDSGTQMWGDTVYVDCDCVVEQQEKGNYVWVEWRGGDCPVPPESKISVMLRGAEGEKYHGHQAGWFEWNHYGNALDIIAYRVIESDGREG